MSLAPELAAFIGRAPIAQPHGVPVKGSCDQGARLRESRTTTEPEELMPTGVYPRKPKAEKEATEPAAKPAKKKAKAPAAKVKPKAPQKPASGPRFGVFEDGTVELRLAGCKGMIAPDDAAALHDFIARLRK